MKIHTHAHAVLIRHMLHERLLQTLRILTRTNTDVMYPPTLHLVHALLQRLQIQKKLHAHVHALIEHSLRCHMLPRVGMKMLIQQLSMTVDVFPMRPLIIMNPCNPFAATRTLRNMMSKGHAMFLLPPITIRGIMRNLTGTRDIPHSRHLFKPIINAVPLMQTSTFVLVRVQVYTCEISIIMSTTTNPLEMAITCHERYQQIHAFHLVDLLQVPQKLDNPTIVEDIANLLRIIDVI
jgi:hypothetical protein